MRRTGHVRYRQLTIEGLHARHPERPRPVPELGEQSSVPGRAHRHTLRRIKGYSNWELLADRANAARRSLELGGLETGKIARIVGMSSSVLFDKENPKNPINRRISIIVMTKQTEQDAQKTDSAGAAMPPLPKRQPLDEAQPRRPA